MGELLERLLLSSNEKVDESIMKAADKFMIVCLFVWLASLNIVSFSAKAQSAGVIVINADGSVTGTSLIQRQGNLFLFTGDIYNSPITVLCSNIILDGDGCALQGSGGWGTPGVAGLENTAAIDLTCSNVTVRNFDISGWEVGVSGAYDSNVIINDNFSRTENAIAIYGDNYVVCGNSLTYSIYGVYVKGNDDFVSQNQIANNYGGVMLYPSLKNTITANNFSNNTVCFTIGTYDNFSYLIYDNNFIINPNNTVVSTTSDALEFGGGGTLPQWDNGSIGNYWSDYATKYPNAIQIGNSDIGDTPYLIRTDPTIIDRYPIMSPVSVQNINESPTTQTAPTTNPNAVDSKVSSLPSMSPPNPSSIFTEVSLITAAIIAVASGIVMFAFRNKFFWLQKRRR
jgi:parallel beta-helix repeat protein